MTAFEIIMCALTAIGLLITVIALFAKNQSEIAVLKSENEALRNSIKKCESDMNLHVTLNERAFDDINKNISSVNSKLDRLIGFFEAKNGGKFNG